MNENQEAVAHLHKLIDEEWEQRMQADPLLATYSGDHRYNDQLPKVSVEAIANRRGNLELLEQQSQQINLKEN